MKTETELAPKKPKNFTLEQHSKGSLSRLVLKNSAVIVGFTVVQKILNLLLFRAMALHYSATDFGNWNTAIALLSFFSLIGDAGIDDIIVREVSQSRSAIESHIGTWFVAKEGLAIISFVVACIFAFLSPYQFSLKIIIILCSIPLFGGFTDIYVDIFQADLKIALAKFAGLISTFFTTLLGFVVIWMNWGIYAQALVLIVTAFPTISYYLFVARKFNIKLSLKVDFTVLKSLFKAALPLALSGLCGIIYYRIDTVLLSLFVNTEQVGYYAATYKLTEALNILPGAIITPLYPIFSRYTQNETSRPQLIKIYHLVIRYLLIIILPIALATTILTKQIILFLYSPEYLPAASALSFIIWAEIPMFLSPIVFYLLVAYKRQDLLLKAAIFMAIFNLTLNLIVIPFYGFYGSALVTSATEFLGLLFGLRFLQRTFQISSIPRIIMILLCLVPFVALLILGNSLSFLIVTIVAGFIYVFCLFVTRAVSWSELKVLISR